MIELIANPEWEHYAHAFHDLNPVIAEYWPENFLNEQYFCRWCEGCYEHGIHYAPALFREDGRYVALVSFNHYSLPNKTAEVDYLAQKPKNMMHLVTQVDRCFECALRTAEIDLLYGIFMKNTKGLRWAKFFRFLEFARVGERVYTYRR